MDNPPDIKQLQNRIAELEAENHALREFICHTPGEHAIFDSQMNYIAATNSYCADYQIEPDNYLGRSHYALFPEMPQRWKDVHSRVLAGATESAEIDGFVLLDGSISYSRWQCRPWYTPEQTIGGIITYTQVINDQEMIPSGFDQLFENLRENEARFEMVLQNSRVTIFTMDAQLRYTWIRNPNSGLSPEEQVGKTDEEVFPQKLADQLTEIKKRVLDTGEPQSSTLHIQTDEKSTWVNSTFEPIFDVQKNIIGVRGVSVDVTEIREVQTKLAESEARFRLAIENSPVTIFAQDDQLRYVWIANPDSGLSVAEHIGKTDEELFPQSLAQKLTAIKCETLKTGEKQRGQMFIESEYTEDVRWVESVFEPVFDEKGDTIGLRGIAFDVTELVQARHKLAENDARFELTLMNSPVVVFTQDNDLRYTWMRNPGWGINPQDVVGKHDDELYPEQLARQLTQIKQQVLVAGTPQREVLRMEHGKLSKWVDAVFEPIIGLDGTTIGLRGVAYDITEIIESQQLLMQTVVKLEEANDELEQFAYIASHDLQEPLRMVTSYVELLRKRYQGQLDERADQYIYFAVEGAKRMKLLIQDLLAISRLNTQENTLREVNLSLLIGQATQNLRQIIQETHTQIVIDEMPTLLVDANRIMQVFQNLIGNAIKYQKKGNLPEIHITAQDNDITWEISVRDNGIGIDSKYHDRVFTIFQRLHTQDEYAGSGIGLALCKKIAALHGGEIWFESEIGRGTTFYFTLPKIKMSFNHD